MSCPACGGLAHRAKLQRLETMVAELQLRMVALDKAWMSTACVARAEDFSMEELRSIEAALRDTGVSTLPLRRRIRRILLANSGACQVMRLVDPE